MADQPEYPWGNRRTGLREWLFGPRKQKPAPPICADTGAPKHPGNCWNVRCQLGGTCCRAAETPADPCQQCEPGGVCSAVECGRKRSSELMQLYGTPSCPAPDCDCEPGFCMERPRPKRTRGVTDLTVEEAYKELSAAWLAYDGSSGTARRMNLALGMLGVAIDAHGAPRKGLEGSCDHTPTKAKS